MPLGLYLHPSDLRELVSGAHLQRLAELGYTDLYLASAYHAGRWYTPWSRAGRVRFLEDGIVHFRPGPASGPLQAQASTEVPPAGPSPLEGAIAQARSAGTRLHAWTVLFHNTRLGELHPGECVTNAFGDTYSYALCPARPQVQAYGLDVVRRLAAHEGLAGIELEAMGWMGHRHGSHHDKSSFAIDRYADRLLSYCFCLVCSAGLDALGVSSAQLRTAVQRAVGVHLDDRDAMVPADAGDPDVALRAALGEDAVAAMLQWRRDVHRAWGISVREAAPGLQLAVQVVPDPWFSGSQLGQDPDVVAGMADELVSTHYGEAVAAIEQGWAARASEAAHWRISFWPKAPQFRGTEDLTRLRAITRRIGASASVYHAGLLPLRTLESVAAVFGAD